MRKLRVFLIGILVCVWALFLIIIFIKPHHVVILDEACVKPSHHTNFKTCNSIHFIIDGKHYVIPKDFETDLASIPPYLWKVVEPNYGDYIAPSLVHDYLYQRNLLANRKFADEVLYSALLSNRVSPYTALLFYIGVRFFGEDSSK